MLEVAEGIQYIHSEGIVHGDICGVRRSLPKPDAPKLMLLCPLLQDNVLLDADLHAQIADFGLTRHSEATVTQSGAMHYHFAAPELFREWARDEEEETSESDDDGQLSTRTRKSDVYAFGCLYYEVGNTLSGRIWILNGSMYRSNLARYLLRAYTSSKSRNMS